MNTRDIASEFCLTHWAGVMRERGGSGESVKEFCARAGLQESVNYYWQRKLREAACEELAIRAQNVSIVSEPPPAPNGWAVCQSGDSPMVSNSLVVEVNGCRVHIERETDRALVAKVCQALKSP